MIASRTFGEEMDVNIMLKASPNSCIMVVPTITSFTKQQYLKFTASSEQLEMYITKREN